MEWHSSFQDSMLVARKPSDWKPDSFDKLSYACEPADLDKMATGLVPIGKITGTLWRVWKLLITLIRMRYALWKAKMKKRLFK